MQRRMPLNAQWQECVDIKTMPTSRTPAAHAPDCKCCHGLQAGAQSLDELSFQKRACAAAQAGNCKRLRQLLAKNPTCHLCYSWPGPEVDRSWFRTLISVQLTPTGLHTRSTRMSLISIQPRFESGRQAHMVFAHIGSLD